MSHCVRPSSEPIVQPADQVGNGFSLDSHLTFAMGRCHLVGLDAIGRVTIAVLNINEPAAVNVRAFLQLEGLYPA